MVALHKHLRSGLHGYDLSLAKKSSSICGDLGCHFVDIFDLPTAYVLDEQL